MKRSRVGLGLLRRASILLSILLAPHLAAAFDKELLPGGVALGEGLLTKDVFLEDKSLGIVADIRFGAFNKGAGSEIGIAGQYGAIFTDKTANVNSKISFKERATHADIIDVEKDGICEFLNRGGVGWQDSSLIGHDGAVLWTHGGGVLGHLMGVAVDDMAAGDLDNDGILDFVVGFNGAIGVHRINRQGKNVWAQRDGNVWHVEIPDQLVDGKRRIVHSNAGGQITIRKEDGSIVSQSRPTAYFSSFSLCRWPGKSDPEHLLHAGNEFLSLIDLEGVEKAELEAPNSEILCDAYGVPVKLAGHAKACLAAVVMQSNRKRSVFYLYDPDHKLIYQEILEEPCSSIAALALDESGNDTILIGGKGRVLSYRPADKAPAKVAK